MRRSLAFAWVFLIPAAAAAQPVEGLYISGGVGANFVGTLQSSHDYTQVYTDTGPVGLMAAGWGFGNGLRAEIEGSYRSNGISGISTLRSNGLHEPLGNSSGTVRTYAVMANVAYDIPLHPFALPVQPYVGAGVGYAWLNMDSATGNGLGDLTGPNVVSFGTAGAFAYQAIAGLSVKLGVVPGLSATLEYRFFGTAQADIPVNRVATTSHYLLASQSTHNGFEVLDNAVLVGLRYEFGAASAPAAAPAAVPAPAVAPARSYLVFFDWDKATLTDRARQIIAEAAGNSTRVQYTRIEVNGYTDTSGTPQYNQGLSIRRAQTVAAELVKDGVPRAAIAIQGFGETHLLVPTGAGVREPQNRRVEIIIR